MGKIYTSISIRIVSSILLAIFLIGPAIAAEPPAGKGGVPLSQYWDFARASADWVFLHQDELIAQWQKSFDPENVFGYRPPGGLLEMAVISASLFEKEKKPEYASRAKQVLLTRPT